MVTFMNQPISMMTQNRLIPRSRSRCATAVVCATPRGTQHDRPDIALALTELVDKLNNSRPV